MVYDLTRINQLKRQKEYEEARDIEWEEIADATNISIATLWRYRLGKTDRPQKNNLLAICDYFGVSLDFFIEDDGSNGEDTSPGNQKGHLISLGSPTVSTALLS